jgi:hypothetical protein
VLETILVGVIVLGAGVWFVRWFRGTAEGSGGCSCGDCGKECARRRDNV